MSKANDDDLDHSIPIVDMTDHHRTNLEAIGWTVILLADRNGGSLCLHATRDGEIDKLPTVTLAYHPIRYNTELLGDGKFGRSAVRPLPKPWEVMTRRGGQGGKWKDESSAVEAFLREAATYP